MKSIYIFFFLLLIVILLFFNYNLNNLSNIDKNKDLNLLYKINDYTLNNKDIFPLIKSVEDICYVNILNWKIEKNCLNIDMNNAIAEIENKIDNENAIKDFRTLINLKIEVLIDVVEKKEQLPKQQAFVQEYYNLSLYLKEITLLYKKTSKEDFKDLFDMRYELKKEIYSRNLKLENEEKNR